MVMVNIDTRDLARLTRKLKIIPGEMPDAILSAINKSLASVNTKMQREITVKYKIKKKDLNGKGNKYKSERSNNLIKLKKATRTNINANIEVRGSSLTLARFLSKPKKPVKTKGKTAAAIKKIPQPTVQVFQGGRKRLSQDPKTFVAKGRGKTIGIFKRQPSGALTVLRTLSVAQMASNPDVLKAVQAEAKTIMAKKISEEINYRFSKIKGGIDV